MKRAERLELALAVAVVAAVLWRVAPGLTLGWWTTAFEPLCGGWLSEGSGEVILRSRVWELIQAAAG